MDVDDHSKKMNLALGEINETFIQSIIEKQLEDHFKKLCDKMNGISTRISSFSYHIDLIQREIYQEKEKILKNCEEKKIFLGSDEYKKQARHIMILIMQRSTYLLRDIIADFFGALDNLAQIIIIYNKNANGKRISSVVKSLRHNHAKDTKIAKYFLEEWSLWIKELYDGYRKDAIHFDPDNCGVSYVTKEFRENNDLANPMEHSENIEVSLPQKIMEVFNYGDKVDILEFCFSLQERLLITIDNSLKNLIE